MNLYIEKKGSSGNSFYVPAYIKSYRKVSNTVNNDPNLQSNVTNFFIDKLLPILNKNKSLNKYYKTIDETDEGFEAIRKLLNLFVKHGNTNWYDLRLQKKLVLKFLVYKIKNL